MAATCFFLFGNSKRKPIKSKGLIRYIMLIIFTFVYQAVFGRFQSLMAIKAKPRDFFTKMFI